MTLRYLIPSFLLCIPMFAYANTGGEFLLFIIIPIYIAVSVLLSLFIALAIRWFKGGGILKKFIYLSIFFFMIIPALGLAGGAFFEYIPPIIAKKSGCKTNISPHEKEYILGSCVKDFIDQGIKTEDIALCDNISKTLPEKITICKDNTYWGIVEKNLDSSMCDQINSDRPITIVTDSGSSVDYYGNRSYSQTVYTIDKNICHTIVAYQLSVQRKDILECERDQLSEPYLTDCKKAWETVQSRGGYGEHNNYFYNLHTIIATRRAGYY